MAPPVKPSKPADMSSRKREKMTKEEEVDALLEEEARQAKQEEAGDDDMPDVRASLQLAVVERAKGMVSVTKTCVPYCPAGGCQYKSRALCSMYGSNAEGYCHERLMHHLTKSSYHYMSAEDADKMIDLNFNECMVIETEEWPEKDWDTWVEEQVAESLKVQVSRPRKRRRRHENPGGPSSSSAGEGGLALQERRPRSPTPRADDRYLSVPIPEDLGARIQMQTQNAVSFTRSMDAMVRSLQVSAQVSYDAYIAFTREAASHLQNGGDVLRGLSGLDLLVF